MYVKEASLLVLFLCFFMHTSYSALPIPTHNKFLPQKKIEEKFKNGREPFEHKLIREEICKKNNAIKGVSSSADCKSSLHKALLQFTKSEDTRWRHRNVREMDLQHLSKTDYDPPHRKSPIHNK
ncbi:uncharacterized protein LOC121804299 [Salvia splendens]|uniref:uncharacterized protein LOC121804299 n=1 Tax=Salvia splendens TaxID=180675 RepID=UPI001C26E792|nr:uncharacterized protein LOC121804299 [Salvia splendens]